MSFDYNPYKHFEIIENENGRLEWYCHSCGGQSSGARTAIVFAGNDSVATIITSYKNHVLNSHGRSPTDFKDWSTY